MRRFAAGAPAGVFARHALLAATRLGVLLLVAMLSGVAAATQDPPPDAVIADLPFLDAIEASGVFVDLAREGAAQPFPLLLDTGASFSMLTPGLARQLGVRVRPSKASPYRRATRLGRDLQFHVDARRGDQASRTGIEFGLLGGNFLAGYVVEIDFAHRRVRFLDADRFRVPEQAAAPQEAVLPLRLVSNRPVLESEIDGHPVSLLLDTGASFGILVGGRVAQALGLDFRPAPGLSAVGVFGEVDVELTEARHLRLGALEFSELPVVVAPHGLRQQGTASDSLLGLDLLSQFTLRVDYPRQRLWLRRDPDSRRLFLGADYSLVRASGALLLRSGNSILAAVILPGGAAQRIGLRPQDVLEGFDFSEAAFDPASPHRAIASEGPLTVRRRDESGRWHSLRLPP